MAKRTHTRISSRSSSSGRTRSQQSQQAEESGMERQHGELHELFLEELADVYNAEQQILKALPKMAQAAESDELREAFESHLQETREHASRVEQAVEACGESMKRKICKAMKGLLEEGAEVLKEHKNSPAIDAALIAAAQKVEHYEIATYGTLCTWAEQMGHAEALELLKENLSEEKTADEKLTSIAESVANQRAQTE